MRISDWSSDVCSSDLRFLRMGIPLSIWTDRSAQELIDPEHCQSRAELPTRQMACNRPCDDYLPCFIAIRRRSRRAPRKIEAPRLVEDRKSTRLNSSH